MNNEKQTLDMLMDNIGKALKAREGVDGGLAEIVSKHILTTKPSQDCVDQAMKAIYILVTKRANPSKENVDG